MTQVLAATPTMETFGLRKPPIDQPDRANPGTDLTQEQREIHESCSSSARDIYPASGIC